jgi:outer membrane protein
MKITVSLRRYWIIAFQVLVHFITVAGCAQPSPEDTPDVFTLRQCIDYTLNNQPFVNQSKLDEAITGKDINISLSGWLPQLNLEGDFQHYLRLPTSFFPDLNDPAGSKVAVASGLINTSQASFSANQMIYSTDLVFAGRAGKDLRIRATRTSESTQISAIVNVSKSFFDVMLTTEQLELWNEEIVRLQRNYEDALHLYQNGLTDNIDFKQALIALNNAKEQKKSTEEAIRVKYSLLKQVMGYSPENKLLISYDSSSLEQEIKEDTLQQLNYDHRIEYRLLQTNMELQKIQTGYYKWSFLPQVSAFYDYNLAYANNRFSPLYNVAFPNSLAGVKLTLPLFVGTGRLQNLQKSKLLYKRLQLSQEELKSQISTEYAQAMAGYKSNLYSLRIARDNSSLAAEVYNTVSLQYKQGIKTYLDLIVAETDLRTSKLNYLTTLFQVISSKLDLKAALGRIGPKEQNN